MQIYGCSQFIATISLLFSCLPRSQTSTIIYVFCWSLMSELISFWWHRKLCDPKCITVRTKIGLLPWWFTWSDCMDSIWRWTSEDRFDKLTRGISCSLDLRCNNSLDVLDEKPRNSIIFLLKLESDLSTVTGKFVKTHSTKISNGQAYRILDFTTCFVGRLETRQTPATGEHFSCYCLNTTSSTSHVSCVGWMAVSIVFAPNLHWNHLKSLNHTSFMKAKQFTVKRYSDRIYIVSLAFDLHTLTDLVGQSLVSWLPSVIITR